MPTLQDIELECFGHFHSKPDQRRYLAMVEGEPIGKIDINTAGPEAELTGFCVVPRSRGKGSSARQFFRTWSISSGPKETKE